jgi:putative NIF3 family GTP cyclohydrolase 1 type 2
MSANRDEIVEYLNEYLQIGKFRDYGPNGMQVIGRPEVRRVGLGVSANLECFRQASERQVDMLIVHHGLFWENMPREIGAMMKARLKILFEHDISLLAYHLPLDAHPEKGNNVLWLDRLGFTIEGVKLGEFRGMPIGTIGIAPGPVLLSDLVEQIRRETGVAPLVYASGPQTVPE